MEWSHQTVLVTGAGGFIGSHLAERLVSLGARTRALVHYNSANSWGWLDRSGVRQDVQLGLGDIQDPASLREVTRGVDIVFHLAALVAIPYSYRAPLSYVRTNVEGTLNVLQAALAAEARLVVHTSTSEVYGSARSLPIDESHSLQGQSPYSASKIGADKIAEAFGSAFGLPIATIRPFNTYGPRQSGRAVIPTIISQALAGRSIKLGNTLPTRDFNYVIDMVDGFIRMAECREAVGEVINIGSGRDVSIGDLVAMVSAALGKPLSVAHEAARVRPQASEVDRLCADNSKALRLLGWRPKFSLEDGLSETIQWVRDNADRYRSGAYAI